MFSNFEIVWQCVFLLGLTPPAAQGSCLMVGCLYSLRLRVPPRAWHCLSVCRGTQGVPAQHLSDTTPNWEYCRHESRCERKSCHCITHGYYHHVQPTCSFSFVRKADGEVGRRACSGELENLSSVSTNRKTSGHKRIRHGAPD